MTNKMEDIVNNILSLPVNSRAYLAEMILESLDFEEDFPINEEWIKEIRGRCQEIDTGKVELIEGDEGLTLLQRKYS